MCGWSWVFFHCGCILRSLLYYCSKMEWLQKLASALLGYFRSSRRRICGWNFFPIEISWYYTHCCIIPARWRDFKNLPLLLGYSRSSRGKNMWMMLLFFHWGFIFNLLLFYCSKMEWFKKLACVLLGYFRSLRGNNMWMKLLFSLMFHDITLITVLL